MTRVTATGSGMDTQSWIKANQERIESHPAWHRDLSATQAEDLLKERDAFTYLLRKGDEVYAYYISFVKEEGGIKHQRFTLEQDRSGWYYQNGCNISLDPTVDIVEQTLDKLIPRMMHCNFTQGTFI